jgi:hypothetical protein
MIMINHVQWFVESTFQQIDIIGSTNRLAPTHTSKLAKLETPISQNLIYIGFIAYLS